MGQSETSVPKPFADVQLANRVDREYPADMSGTTKHAKQDELKELLQHCRQFISVVALLILQKILSLIETSISIRI